mmetsp:Transcript_45549/g.67690  ORF Transcript_45549/g.67690 Transcript_45549/m.67690 type:complete len:93 (-) Transcript_45549:539-817(-)
MFCSFSITFISPKSHSKFTVLLPIELILLFVVLARIASSIAMLDRIFCSPLSSRVTLFSLMAMPTSAGNSWNDKHNERARRLKIQPHLERQP